jgi:ATP-dependent 26S proteasome regulatory subunit
VISGSKQDAIAFEVIQHLQKVIDHPFDFAMFISVITVGLSPADIKMVTEEAMKSVIIDARNILEMGDLETAIKSGLCFYLAAMRTHPQYS